MEHQIKNKINTPHRLSRIARNRGMTYVELIVVLSIFAVVSSVVVFNYGSFQSKVDLKNLATDIALKIVESQKASLSGLIPASGTPVGWKPTYGVFFNTVNPLKFNNFVDLNSDGEYDKLGCTPAIECLNRIDITKGNSISRLDVFYQNELIARSVVDLTITFKRPNSGATFRSTTGLNPSIAYVQITVTSPRGITAIIKLYPSGRIEVI